MKQLSKADQFMLNVTFNLAKLTLKNMKELLEREDLTDEQLTPDLEIFNDVAQFFKKLTGHLWEKYIPGDVRKEMEAKRLNEEIQKTIETEIRKAKGEVF